MKKNFKRLLGLLLAVAICLPFVTLPTRAASLSDLVAADGSVTITEGVDTTVTVGIATPGDISLLGIQGTWSTTEEEDTGYLTLTDIGSDSSTISFTGTNAKDPATGYLIWGDDTFSNPAIFAAGENVITATYTVPAGTPAGEYTVKFTAEAIIDGDFNIEAPEFTVKITVVDPNASTQEECWYPITSLDELTTGKYVVVASNGYAMGSVSGTWVTAWQPAIENGFVVDEAPTTWTLTVTGSTVTLMDANNVYVAPKGGNTNGIASSEYSWAVSCTDGKFVFAGQGSDTVYLASNHGSNNQFRGYKVSTLTGTYASSYSYEFTLYKWGVPTSGGEGGDTSTECTHTNATHVTAAGATCLATGNIEHWFCEDCGKYFSDASCTTEIAQADTVIAKSEHDYNNLEDGRKCVHCGYYKPNSTLTIEEAIAFGNSYSKDTYTADKYYVTGVITEVYNTTYGNMYITDGTNTLTIYGTWSADGSARYDAMATKPVAGDTITVYGVIGKYNSAQMKNGWVTEIIQPTCYHNNVTFREAAPATCTTPATLAHYYCDDCKKNYADQACTQVMDTIYVDDVLLDHDYNNPDDGRKCIHCGYYKPDSILTIEEAIAFGDTYSKDTYTADKYYVTGLIESIASTKYGNMTITDGTFSLYIYGTWSADGSARYDAMETKPVAGDTITVYGVIGKYNSAQMKNGWITAHIPAHTCGAEGTLTETEQENADCGNSGHKAYWTCSCGKVYADAAATTEIPALAAWLAEGGEGYIAATGEHVYVPGTYTWSVDYGTCTVVGTCACSATATATASSTSSVTTVGTCQTAQVVTYTADFEETWAVDQSMDVTGVEDLNNHTSNAVTYTNNGDGTHSATYDCCGGAYVTNEAHDYNGTSGYTCICGDVKQFKVYWYDSNGNELGTSSVDYGAPLPTCPYNPTIPEGYYGVGWHDMYAGDPAPETMPANNLYLKYFIERNLYTVTLLYEDGETWKVYTNHHGDVIEDLAGKYPYPDTKEGHTFIGWGVKNAATGEIELVTTMTATGNLTLYPVFEVNEYTLTVYILATGDSVELTVPYGTNVLEVLAQAAADGKIPAIGDQIRYNNVSYNGYTRTIGYSYWVEETSEWIYDLEGLTMPAADFAVDQDYEFYNGWLFYYDGNDEYVGAEFLSEEVYLTGWNYIAEDYDGVEGGAWYYFAEGTDGWEGYYFRAEGLTRVPYPTVSINGVTYAPNAEDVAYAESKGNTFIDKDEAWFIFDENGKFQSDVTGKIEGKYATCYAVDGMIPWHYGLVKITNKYYYFVGDTVNGGNKIADGPVWITRTNGVQGLDNGACYYFLGGVLAHNLTDIVDGKYYENGKLMMGAGLVKLGEGYIYVRSSGQVALGEYWVTEAKANGYVEGGKLYNFGQDGYLVIDPTVNGIVNGVYYKEGVPYYAGLIDIEGDIYYVNSRGQVVTGTYYVTKTNGMDGFEKGDKLVFGEDGKLETIKDGIVEDKGVYYYYEKNHLKCGAGVVEMTDENGDIFYIYVRSNGQLATGIYWPTARNGYLDRGAYDWGTDGRYYPSEG